MNNKKRENWYSGELSGIHKKNKKTEGNFFDQKESHHIFCMKQINRRKKKLIPYILQKSCSWYEQNLWMPPISNTFISLDFSFSEDKMLTYEKVLWKSFHLYLTLNTSNLLTLLKSHHHHHHHMNKIS